MAEHADVCGAYASYCPILGAGGDRGGGDVGELCVTGREEACFAACTAAACCFPHKFGLGAQGVCDGGEREEWCDDFRACEILPDVGYGVMAVGDEGPVHSNVTVLAPEEDNTANINAVTSDTVKDDDNLVHAVNSHCAMSQIDTSEAFLACSTLCSKRRCCFDFGPMNCLNARKEWCDEVSLCNNLIEVQVHKNGISLSNANNNAP
jgi:hypothetical protein